MKLNGGVYNIKTKYNQDGLWYNELKTQAENDIHDWEMGKPQTK